MQDDASASSSLYDACPEYASTRWFILTQQERFVSLLRQWDVDGDGCINPKEFRDACRVMLLDGPNVPRAVLEELYEEIDVDGTSNIPFEDLETALRVMPCPDPPRGLETVDEDTVDAGAASPTTVAARRDRRRSKSEPSSPQTSARSHASPTPRRLLFDTSAQSPGSPTTRRPTTLPSVAKPLTMHASGAQSLHTSPVCRPPNIQPPRRTNLPALSPRSVGGDSPRSHRSLGRASHHSYSYSSSSTTTTRTRSISPKLRAQREKELTAQLERRRLPGFQTPGVGKYDLSGDSIGARASAVRSSRTSSWALDGVRQHVTHDYHGRVIPDSQHKTKVGDPGIYVSHLHEMGADLERTGGLGAVMMSSAVPQRPII